MKKRPKEYTCWKTFAQETNATNPCAQAVASGYFVAACSPDLYGIRERPEVALDYTEPSWLPFHGSVLPFPPSPLLGLRKCSCSVKKIRLVTYDLQLVSL